MDGNEVLVAALGAVCAVVLVVVALAWRRMIARAPELPIWRFLRRAGITRDDAADTLSAQAVMQAELGCTVCGNRESCRARLAAGGDAVPPANCPNAPLFDDFGIAVEQIRK